MYFFGMMAMLCYRFCASAIVMFLSEFAFWDQKPINSQDIKNPKSDKTRKIPFNSKNTGIIETKNWGRALEAFVHHGEGFYT